ncbi:hypothetical protein GEMRC1_004441 [Eukaryota sp. GEM-RC1]
MSEFSTLLTSLCDVIYQLRALYELTRYHEEVMSSIFSQLRSCSHTCKLSLFDDCCELLCHLVSSQPFFTPFSRSLGSSSSTLQFLHPSPALLKFLVVFTRNLCLSLPVTLSQCIRTFCFVGRFLCSKADCSHVGCTFSIFSDIASFLTDNMWQLSCVSTVINEFLDLYCATSESRFWIN